MPGINEIKRIRSLSEKKYRDALSLFVVEGEKLVDEALRSPFEVVSVYRRDEVGEDVMKKMSSLSSPSPVLAVVRKPENIEAESLPAKGLFLFLDGIRDPGNLGTIIRIADWYGVDGVYASPDTVDLYNPKVVQSTMGAVFRVPFHSCELPSLCRRFTLSGGTVYGPFLDGEDIYSAALRLGDSSPVAVVVGNEANGISWAVASEVSARLFIPPYPSGRRGSESLNAAVATAITVSEFRRRSANG